MLNLERKTRLPQPEVAKRLKDFFGEGGLGLTLREESATCYTFEGAGGYVTATLCEAEGETTVELITMEWEVPVKEFAAKLP